MNLSVCADDWYSWKSSLFESFNLIVSFQSYVKYDIYLIYLYLLYKIMKCPGREWRITLYILLFDHKLKCDKKKLSLYYFFFSSEVNFHCETC